MVKFGSAMKTKVVEVLALTNASNRCLLLGNLVWRFSDNTV